ncbi:hypothetical protein F511_21445 [Dorcoceras hygrometricum]|uniref:Uncharacterized protein n=1 Tax=Dorcoceras hygrometricum TaxID=472368 RepID=A0A2Z7CBI3_9LAMI|nr:hypothetical protein F511_21445 [Dorcoceras hygrometricum]
MSLYRRLEYNTTRIMVFFRIMDVTSGPDLIHTYSYTSILRLGLTAGDTPDAPIVTSSLEDREARGRPRPMLLSSRGYLRTRYQDQGVDRRPVSRSGFARGLTISSGVFPENCISS